MQKETKELPNDFELSEAEIAARNLLDGKAEVVEAPEEMDCEEFWRRVEELLQPLADKGLLV